MGYRGLKVSALAICCLCLAVAIAKARDVTVTLNDGSQVVGTLLNDDMDHLLLSTRIGQVKIPRDRIRTVLDAPFANLQSAQADSSVLNDQVVVYLTDGSTLDGFLVAKSLGMVMLRNELGRFTISKDKIQRIEYVSAPYGEKGESVRLTMTDGSKQRGVLLAETPSTLTLITQFGQVMIDKKNLRAMEYGVELLFNPFKPYEPPKSVSPSGITPGGLVDEILQNLYVGMSSGMGEEFKSGFLLGGGARKNLIESDAYDLAGAVSLDFRYSGIDKSAIGPSGFPGGVDVSGHNFVTRLGLSAPVFLHMRGPSRLQFYLEPSLDVLIVAKKVEVVYLSFPDAGTDDRSTDLRLGAGLQAGFEYAIHPTLAVGAGVGRTSVFGDADIQGISIHVTSRPFF